MPIDATVGGSLSNSYVTLVEASDYFADRAHGEVWPSLLGQEAALITASRMLDWVLKWKGSPLNVSPPQAMGWPRVNVVDEYGVPVDPSIIPSEVKYATFELALANIPADRAKDKDLAGLREVKVGPLMIKSDATSLRSSTPKTVPDFIRDILKGLIVDTTGIRVIHLVRA